MLAKNFNICCVIRPLDVADFNTHAHSPLHLVPTRAQPIFDIAPTERSDQSREEEHKSEQCHRILRQMLAHVRYDMLESGDHCGATLEEA